MRWLDSVGIGRIVPGFLLCAVLAVLATYGSPWLNAALERGLGASYRIPEIIIVFILGMVLSGAVAGSVSEPGAIWCVKGLLRFAIALLGVRIALSDIASLGIGVAFLIIAAMAVTVVTGVLLARIFRLGDGLGALAGAATAVCGASAALATSIVVPQYGRKEVDIAFTVIAANAFSTAAMLAYPPLCLFLGLEAGDTGVVLGATIHDMAQVVGAGYAVSDPVGNVAVIVKLYRIFLLLPVVMLIGWWFSRSQAGVASARPPVPVFALGFLALCCINSMMPLAPTLLPAYAPIKDALVQVSKWGLLIAMAALGLRTSMASLRSIGWRHFAVFTGTTIILLACMLGGIIFLI